MCARFKIKPWPYFMYAYDHINVLYVRAEVMNVVFTCDLATKTRGVILLRAVSTVDGFYSLHGFYNR
jgi:hypothetical protein